MKQLLQYTVIIIPLLCTSQNLVLNGSFEEYTSGTFTTYWHSASQSIDYYNNDLPSSSTMPLNVPLNWAGYQCPYDGQSYIGGTVFLSNISPTLRESAQGKLTTPLQVGAKYFVSFKVSNSGTLWLEQEQPLVSIKKIGALFTNTLYPTSFQCCPNNAQTYTNAIITDTTNWTSISGSFIADSAYQYIMLGNFFDDVGYLANPDTGQLLAYYYYDDVRVSTDSAYVFGVTSTTNNIEICEGEIAILPSGKAVNTNGIYLDTLLLSSGCTSITTTRVVVLNCDTTSLTPQDSTITFTMPSAFTPNNDGVNDSYYAVPPSVNAEAFRVYNRWGQIVFETNNSNIGWDGKYKAEPQPTDVYAYYIQVKLGNNKIESRTGSFTLLQ